LKAELETMADNAERKQTGVRKNAPAPQKAEKELSSRDKQKKERVKPDPRKKLFTPEQLFFLSPSPHQSTNSTVPRVMWGVFLALLPASGMALFYFGTAGLRLIATCVCFAVLTEALLDKLRGKTIRIRDGSAAVTGLLLALTLPPTFSLSGSIIGSVFAIAIGKQIFGGLGYNIFNPALLGRAFLQACFPVQMTTWVYPATSHYKSMDAVSAATPLGQFKFEKIFTAYPDLLVGNIGGSLGETSAAAILIGGIYLLVRGYADWRIPVSMSAGLVFFAGLFWLISPGDYPDPVFQLLAGGFMLAVFFMATDPVTSPITPKGLWIFGFGAAFLIVIIRLFGGLPEGVMYAILLMNAVTPLINRYTRPKFFGAGL
jgi:electron transport complex protein RnfD